MNSRLHILLMPFKLLDHCILIIIFWKPTNYYNIRSRNFMNLIRIQSYCDNVLLFYYDPNCGNVIMCTNIVYVQYSWAKHKWCRFSYVNNIVVILMNEVKDIYVFAEIFREYLEAWEISMCVTICLCTCQILLLADAFYSLLKSA